MKKDSESSFVVVINRALKCTTVYWWGERVSLSLLSPNFKHSFSPQLLHPRNWIGKWLYINEKEECFCIIKDINVKKREKVRVKTQREKKNCVQSKLCNFSLIKLHSGYDDDDWRIRGLVRCLCLQEERIPDCWQIN